MKWYWYIFVKGFNGGGIPSPVGGNFGRANENGKSFFNIIYFQIIA